MEEYLRGLRQDELSALKLREMYRRYGYIPYRMRQFEEYELYLQNRNFLRSDRILTFTDTDGSLRAMKPDIMLSFVRSYSGDPLYKVSYSETVIRPDDSGFREIRQTGLECIGEVDILRQSEVVLLAWQSLSLSGQECILDLSHLGFTRELVDSLVPEDMRRKVMKAIGAKNTGLLKKYGAELPEEDVQLLMKAAELYGRAEDMLGVMQGMIRTPAAEEAYRELADTVKAVKSVVPEAVLNIDLSMIDDLNYYNGLIFRGMLKGIPQVILSGGRYDNLLKRMNKPGRAIGFAVYLDLLERSEMAENEPVKTVSYTENSDPAEILKQLKDLYDEGFTVQAVCDGGVQG